jgi:hypothetical protein
MKLLAVTSGRSTGTICVAFSFCRMKTWVTMRSPGMCVAASPTGPALVFASASGTILTNPPSSTAA